MFCSKCGKEVNENATFCRHCGNKLNNKIEKKYDFKSWIKNFKIVLIISIIGIIINSILIFFIFYTPLYLFYHKSIKKSTLLKLEKKNIIFVF